MLRCGGGGGPSLDLFVLGAGGPLDGALCGGGGGADTVFCK